MRDPGPGLHAFGNVCNRIIRDANDDEVPARADGDAALLETSSDGRADTTGTDDGDSVEHL
jgi:hypothetical protein